MAPKAMKAMKASLPKGGKNGALPKGTKKTTLTKGGQKAAMKVKKPAQKEKPKASLNKGALEKLGKMTLAQKIAKASEEAANPEEAAQALKQLLSKQEHSKVWSKHQTWLRNQATEEEQKEFEGKGKLDKGLAAAMHLVKQSVPKFMHVRQTVSQSQQYDKKEKWVSEKKMQEEFGDELWLHLQSGRVEWRNDPWTPGVYNYRDRGNVTKRVRVSKEKEYSTGQEYEAEEKEEEQFQLLWGKDEGSHLADAESFGKGKALTKGKGKSKGKLGKGKGKGGPLALLDGNVEENEEEEEEAEEPSEEEQWKELLKKAKRARDQSSAVKDDLEAAMEKAERAARLTKAAKKDADALVQRLTGKVEELKKLLAKKEQAMGLTKAKELLATVAKLVKETKDEAKEMNQVANRAGSRAGSKISA